VKEKGRLRLFVAANVPDAHLREIEGLTEPLRAAIATARWTPLENQHITLKFLGATSSEDVPGVRAVCAAVASSHVRSRVWLAGIGAFPNLRRARVLWVGVDDPFRSLARLASDLDAGFRPLGFAPEERAYTPHLTLARLKTPVRIDAVPELRAEELPPVSIEQLSLYRSRPSPRGAVYELMDSFALA
jgi:2'-5' RNA ligase